MSTQGWNSNTSENHQGPGAVSSTTGQRFGRLYNDDCPKGQLVDEEHADSVEENNRYLRENFKAGRSRKDSELYYVSRCSRIGQSETASRLLQQFLAKHHSHIQCLSFVCLWPLGSRTWPPRRNACILSTVGQKCVPMGQIWTSKNRLRFRIGPGSRVIARTRVRFRSLL